jgi:aryl-alcohol dehydrogenase-like predicted oxidoreductase
MAMPTRRLGRTEHHSSVAVLGGAAFWGTEPDVTASVFSAAIDAGVNHLDVAPRYGRAQELLGPLVAPVRDALFVACKTMRHDPHGVRAQLEESLTLLHCDSFDLYQMHAVTDLDELDARARAVTAIMAARDEGLCRFVGITGHNLTTPGAQLEALRRYDLDTVMFPVNPRLWADPAYRHDGEALLAEAEARDVGVMAIKAVAARPWGERPHTATTWYEAYTSAADIGRGVRFVLGTPGVHALCTPSDPALTLSAIEAAARDEPMSEDERTAAVRDTAAEDHIFPMPGA